MKGFLLHERSGEGQRCSDVLAGHVVFGFDLFEAHKPGKAAEENGDGHADTANHGLAMTDARIDGDTVLDVEGDKS